MTQKIKLFSRWLWLLIPAGGLTYIIARELGAQVASQTIERLLSIGTYTGIASVSFGVLADQGVAIAIGSILGPCTFFLNWYYRHQMLKQSRINSDVSQSVNRSRPHNTYNAQTTKNTH